MRSRLEEINRDLSRPDAWDDSRRAQDLAREAASLTSQLACWEQLSSRAEGLVELFGLLESEHDPEFLVQLLREQSELEGELETRELDLLFADPYAHHNAIMGVKAGAGGVDAQDWAEMLLRMYLRWAESKGFGTEILELSEGEEAGIKGATVRVVGDRAFGLLMGERGTHRLVRLSPFDSAHRRHTSFALVELWPEVEDTAEVEIRPDDLRIDTYRSTGAGGQHVNKTDSAVRITHLPSGIVVACQNERSQIKNRERAMTVLRARLFERQIKEAEAQRAELKGAHVAAEWGNQIRSYVLHPYTLVKDHRTEVEVGNVNGVLAGDLDPLIQTYLRWSLMGGPSRQ